MKCNPNDLAFPTTVEVSDEGGFGYTITYTGLTKLEVISAMVLQGLSSNAYAFSTFDRDDLVVMSVKGANSLIKELNKSEGGVA